MKCLLDTHLLLWAAARPDLLPDDVTALLAEPGNDIFFSVASLWEVAIKAMLGRDDFAIDPRRLRRGLLENGYQELPIEGPHILALLSLPPLHKDPFDRLLVAQATTEGITLWTSDVLVAQYPGTLRKV